jgi:hypothetical protein
MRLVRCPTCGHPFGLIDVGASERETLDVQATFPVETVRRLGARLFAQVAAAEFYDALLVKAIEFVGDHPFDPSIHP